MDLNSIENLNEVQILDIYQDVLYIESDLISMEACNYSACPCGCSYTSKGMVDRSKCIADVNRGYCK